MEKTKIFAIILLSALAIGTFAALPLQTASAVSLKNYAVIDAIPNPVGVGEDVLIRTGVLRPLGSVLLGWEGVTVTVTKPDNTTQTLGPVKTDSTGVTFIRYTPDQIGTYKLQTHFPQQNATSSWSDAESGGRINQGDVMLAADSEVLELVVQEESLPSYPGHALPTEYWSRPIDPQLREWFSISGNWVARPDNSLALYNNDAPETAHVLWANPLTTGGLMGGLWGDNVPSSAETGDAYEGKYPGSVVLNGILYYQRTDTRNERAPAIIAVDLHTGEEWLYKNNTILSFGQVLYFNSYNYDGTFSYIWSVSGSTYTAYDPFTGNQQLQFVNVPSGFRTFGPSGEILIYQIDYTNGWMALWNSTDCGLQYQNPAASGYGSWGNSAHGQWPGAASNAVTLWGNSSRSYSWNVTIPKGIQVQASFGVPTFKIYQGDRIVGVFYNQSMVRTWALPLNTITFKNSNVATQSISTLFYKTWTAPAEWIAGSNTIHYTGASNELDGGVIAVWDKELRKHYGFSVQTGDYLWETESEFYSDAYGWGNAEHTWYFAYGKLYSVGLGGIVYAYDQATGKTAWTYTMDDAYNEPVTGQNWWGWITLIADNKIYVGTVEHSAEQPLPRGGPQICINASNGAEIWRVNGMFRNTRWGGNGVIGDSIIATMDTYDQRVYGIGKGSSSITVSAPESGLMVGDSMIIKGNIYDTSPGTKTPELTARFPNGLPAVSDASQSQWMLYAYKQFERPTNVTGVPVELSVVDANGNYRVIGTTTSDSDGFYSMEWSPDIEGKYTLYASFLGSAAYYPSHAVTAFAAAPEPQATAEPTPQQPSTADLYFLPMSIAILIAVIVIGLVIILVVNKKP